MEDTTLVNRGSSPLDFNNYYNFHMESLSKHRLRRKTNKTSKTKLNKVNSPQNKQEISTPTPDFVYIFHLQQKVEEKQRREILPRPLTLCAHFLGAKAGSLGPCFPSLSL